MLIEHWGCLYWFTSNKKHFHFEITAGGVCNLWKAFQMLSFYVFIDGGWLSKQDCKLSTNLLMNQMLLLFFALASI